MAMINGIEIKAVQTKSGADGCSQKTCSLYLGRQKIAYALIESWEKCNYDNSVQLFMMHGLSEDKLLSLLAAANGEGYTISDFIDELEWLSDLEKEFMRHVGSPNGGMVTLNYQGMLVHKGIPMRYASASDAEILDALKAEIDMYQRSYGKLESYLVMHSPADFRKGTPITIDQLEA